MGLMSDPRPRFSGGLSTDPDTARATAQVADALATALDGASPDLLTVFVSHHHGGEIEALGPRLIEATGARVLLGCTGESIIGAGREIENGPALSVWGATLPGTEVRPFAVHATPGPQGEALFTRLPEVADPARASLLLLADPFSFPMDEYLKTLNREMPGVPAVGGMASGGMGPGQNLLLTAEGLVAGGAIGAVLEGDIEVRSVVSQGCRPIGKPWVVTDCEAGILRKLGGKPAMDVLIATVRDLEPDDQQLFQSAPFMGLAIDASKSTFERGDFLVRPLIGLRGEEKAIEVADMLRRGQTVQFLVRDAASASEDLTQLMNMHGSSAPAAKSTGALLFSCNGRGTRMFDQPDHDVSAVQSGLDATVPVAGFFAMGEIGPVGGRNFLHGFTASVAVFRSRG
jgi:small ligand-binding sensory domain FIST